MFALDAVSLAQHPGGEFLKQFMASDGVAVAYEDDGTGRPLLLLHGLMAHSGFFIRQRELAQDFRLISIDLRGHGRSRHDRAALTVERLAQDVAELADYLEMEDAIGLGWSLGATVLWHVLAGPSSHRFSGSVIVDMSPRVLNEDHWQLGLAPELCQARTDAIREDFAGFAQGAGQAIFAQPVREEALARWAGDEFARNVPDAMDGLWSSLVAQDVRPLLPGIVQPTLIIHGAHSQLYGSGTADYLVKALPHADAVQFDRSGHAPQLEQPELFNRSIRDFAASLPRVPERKATA
jgi:pimeloyl-ACP methyl ester carboxylesterase